MTFFSDQDFLSVKFNDADELKDIRDGARSPLYNTNFHNSLPKIQNDIGAEIQLEKAREVLQRQFPDAVIENDYIVQFRFCSAPVEGKTSKFGNGCRRNGPLIRWKVWLKMTPKDGKWLTKEIFFGDEEAAVVKDGPRGFFE